MSLDRRSFLGAGALLAAPRVLFAQAATERRFIFIIQRGAADGLNTVIPYADPAYATARGALAIDPASAVTMELGDHFRPIPVAEKARMDLLKESFASQREFR